LLLKLLFVFIHIGLSLLTADSASDFNIINAFPIVFHTCNYSLNLLGHQMSFLTYLYLEVLWLPYVLLCTYFLLPVTDHFLVFHNTRLLYRCSYTRTEGVYSP